MMNYKQNVFIRQNKVDGFLKSLARKIGVDKSIAYSSQYIREMYKQQWK